LPQGLHFRKNLYIMDRRESLRTLIIGTVATGAVISGCVAETNPKENNATPAETETGLYGRTEKEKAWDKKVMSEKFFTTAELATIAILCDIIIPADDISVAATQAKVPEFIEFIVKDMPYHQLPLRGGLMWLDHESNKRFGKVFSALDGQQRIAIVDAIAYPDKAAPELSQGVKFFELIRDLTVTGFYTTKEGFDALGYVGNRPNVWDGVPEEELQRVGMAYEPEWLKKCIDQSTRETLATWDDAGNLLT